MKRKKLMNAAVSMVMAAVLVIPSTAFAAPENKAVASTLAEETLAKAPKISKVELQKDFLGSYYRVSFTGNVEGFLNGARQVKVTLNGNEAKKVSSFFGDTNSYKFSNDPAYGGSNCFIDFTEDCFKSGEVKVEINVEGYEILRFTMQDGKLKKEETPETPEALLNTPTVKEIKNTSDFVGSYYRVSFAQDEKTVGAYLESAARGSILINGTTAKKVSSFFGDTNSYKFSTDPIYGGANCFIDFTEDCFKSKEVKVEVKAPGYKDLVFYANNGVLTEKEEAPKEIKFATLVKTVDLGWSKYIVVDLEDGYDLNNVTFEVDGVKVQPTKVTDDGNIVKWEVTSLEHKELVLSNENGKQSVNLGGKASKAKVYDEKTTPDYFLANGPVYVWDYHLRNFDDNGNVRVVPSKTTFSLKDKDTRIKSYSPLAELIPSDEGIYGVTGEVELMFNYEKGTKEEKTFVDGITDVDLVAFNEQRNTINSDLVYTLDKAFPHNGNTVACIKVPLGQTNFYSNGRYYLRVTSNGKGSLFPIHVVNSVTPSMTLTDDKVVAGQDEVHFRVKDMTYGVTMPIEKVTLTNPDGETMELTKIDDWYLIGDLFILYNNESNFLAKEGNYTIDVYATGFKPFSKTFAVGSASKAKLKAKAQTLDAVTSASLEGGSGSGSEGASGSNVMNANLVFNADLLTNAKIMVALGIHNSYAEGISDRWDSMNKLSVYMKGGQEVYDAPLYFDAVNEAKTKGEYLTFADYRTGDKAVTTKNRPAAVKQVLEDNLLGDTTTFNESSAHQVPDMILLKTEGQKVTFKVTDPKYLKALDEKGELLLNSDHLVLPKNKYKVDLKESTLTINEAKTGENKLMIRVPGYQTFKMVFECEKTLQEVKLEVHGNVVGEPVSVTCTAHKGEKCDFFANLKTVKMIAPNGQERNVRPDGEEGFGIGYTYEDPTLTIGGRIFTEKWAQNEDGTLQSGEYTILLNSEYYGEQKLTVKLTAASTPEEKLDTPSVKEIKKDGSFLYDYYSVSFTGDEKTVSEYVKAVNGISVNGKKVDKVSGFFNTQNGYMKAADPVYGGAETMINLTTDCLTGTVEVVISAEGYEDLKFNVKDGTLVEKEEKPEVSEKADKAELDKLIKSCAETYKKDEYTEETWSVYEEALHIAKEVMEDEDATQDAVNEAVKALTESAEGLKKIEKPETDDNKNPEVPETDDDKKPEVPETDDDKKPEVPETDDDKKPEVPETDDNKKPEVPETDDNQKPEVPETDGDKHPEIQEDEDKKPESQGTETDKKPEDVKEDTVPKTGDTSNVFTWTVLMIVALGAVLASLKKKILK